MAFEGEMKAGVELRMSRLEAFVKELANYVRIHKIRKQYT